MRLNIGSGSNKLLGYFNVDLCFGDTAYPLTLDKLPINDALYDEVRASHILEHFNHRETKHVLAEWVRVLKPGGILKLAVPNFKMLCYLYLIGADVDFIGTIMGGQIDGNDYHKAIFDTGYLSTLMTNAGITKIKPWISLEKDCSGFPISLNLCGIKQ